MPDFKSLARRSFITGALVTTGATIGWVFRKSQKRKPPTTRNQTVPKNAFEYDVSAYMKTDPDLLLYQFEKEFNLPFERVKSILLSPNGHYIVAGDRAIKTFSPDGIQQLELSLSRPPHCMAVTESGLLWVGIGQFCEIYDLETLEKQFQTEPFGENSYLTSMATHEDRVYIADAGKREMTVLDGESGKELFRFGKKSDVNPGFNVPSPYFDFVIGRDLKLHISNPGMLRVETYTMDGRFESSWGNPGMQPDAFCGCCNPVFISQLPGGEFITSEKGLTRLKVYSELGEFKGVVAGPEQMVEDEALAKKACGDCSIGSGFDVIADANGNVITLDPFKRSLRVFTPLKEEA
ncbi:hypothetical protein OAM01_00710 [bacterium]|nr:hypothetical protein [bacterium]